ncbi:hypothetical protein Misp01_04610 [Microtetraspora sp. NBRC 13810]|nr:hypothetical protein Misp01_04610 [Microtetraspora sp. NBRC 13810]
MAETALFTADWKTAGPDQAYGWAVAAIGEEPGMFAACAPKIRLPVVWLFDLVPLNRWTRVLFVDCAGFAQYLPDCVVTNEGP